MINSAKYYKVNEATNADLFLTKRLKSKFKKDSYWKGPHYSAIRILHLFSKRKHALFKSLIGLIKGENVFCHFSFFCTLSHNSNILSPKSIHWNEVYSWQGEKKRNKMKYKQVFSWREELGKHLRSAEGCMNKNSYKKPFSNIYPIINA